MKNLKQCLLAAIILFAETASAQIAVLNIPEDGAYSASTLRAGAGGVAYEVNLSTALGSTSQPYSLVTASAQGIININGGRYAGSLLVNNGGRIKIDDLAEIPENFTDIEIRPTGELVIEFGKIERGIYNEGTLTIFDGNFANKSIFLESGSFTDITGGSFMPPSNPLAGRFIDLTGSAVLNIAGSNVVPLVRIRSGSEEGKLVFQGTEFKINGNPVTAADVVPEEGVFVITARSESSSFPALTGKLLDGTDFTFDLQLGADHAKVAINQIPSIEETPTLAISRQPDGGILISWPATVVGYTLESSPTLGDPWTLIPTMLNQHSIPAESVNGSLFFRLRK